MENTTGEKVTISRLIEEMGKYTEEPYSRRYMRQKLQNYYGDDVSFLVYPGDKTVVVLGVNAESILKAVYSQRPKESTDQEKLRIIRTAAQLILADINSLMAFSNDESYPTVDSLSNTDNVPTSLKELLQTMIKQKSEIKKTAIAQSIIQAAHPRSMSMPLQIFLAVHLHNRLGKKNIIDELASLGFCKSYKEVRKFLRNAAISWDTQYINLQPGQDIQFAADNVDWNRDTIDGRNTIHWMGQIAAITPTQNQYFHVVPRKNVTSEEILKLSSKIV